jgi:hypothetical protein
MLLSAVDQARKRGDAVEAMQVLDVALVEHRDIGALRADLTRFGGVGIDRQDCRAGAGREAALCPCVEVLRQWGQPVRAGSQGGSHAWANG